VTVGTVSTSVAPDTAEAHITDKASLDRVVTSITELLKETPGATVHVTWRIGP
jgi:hypothetical protein